MFYVYVLESITRKEWLYVGYTANLRKRLKQHRDGTVRSTKTYLPLKLVYYEAYRHSEDAMKRERMLKNYKRTFGGLKRRLHNSLTQY